MPQTRTVVLLPPAQFTQPCPQPSTRLGTTGDIVTDSRAAHQALKNCAAQVAKLAQWRKAHQ